MKKIIFCAIIATCQCGLAHAVNCTTIMEEVDTSNNYQLDVDGDGTKDFWFFAALTPYVNSYILGLNGNEIEVKAPNGTDFTRARRLVAGNPIGVWYWNDTAYLIKNGQGDFAGGSEEFGWVGLKLYKSGNWHYCFVELRAPYSQPIISVYRSGYNSEPGSPLKADDCSTAVPERNLIEANAFISGDYLRVLLANQDALNSNLQLVNVTGQTILEEKIKSQDNSIALNNLQSGIYFAAIRNGRQLLYRTKVFIP